jgi:hypothetical protein
VLSEITTEEKLDFEHLRRALNLIAVGATEGGGPPSLLLNRIVLE